MNSGVAPVSKEGNPYNSDLPNSAGLSTFKRLPKRRVKAPCLRNVDVNYYCTMTIFIYFFITISFSLAVTTHCGFVFTAL